jgi:Spy/CpxP family protein refolding chaperone
MIAIMRTGLAAWQAALTREIRTMRRLVLALVLLAPTLAFAQAPGHHGPSHGAAHGAGHGAGQGTSHARGHHGGHAGAEPGHAMPYAGFQTREIKALSDQQIADLRAGRGMALALAAELNRYPGPMHVLEHAAALSLTPEQTATMERLIAQMRAQAVTAGEQVIAAERALDRLFAEARADDASLAAAITDAARAQGEVRRIHLATHIATRAALTPAQIDAYDRLRGYR